MQGYRRRRDTNAYYAAMYLLTSNDDIIKLFLQAQDRVRLKNGIILLMLAFLISPMGLPMLALWGLGKLQGANAAMKNFIHS